MDQVIIKSRRDSKSKSESSEPDDNEEPTVMETGEEGEGEDCEFVWYFCKICHRKYSSKKELTLHKVRKHYSVLVERKREQKRRLESDQTDDDEDEDEDHDRPKKIDKLSPEVVTLSSKLSKVPLSPVTSSVNEFEPIVPTLCHQTMTVVEDKLTVLLKDDPIGQNFQKKEQNLTATTKRMEATTATGAAALVVEKMENEQEKYGGPLQPMEAAVVKVNSSKKKRKRRSYKCGRCAIHYSDYQRLQQHKKMHEAVAQRRREGFCCKFCKKVFATNKGWRNHEKNHEGADEIFYNCDQSEEAFSSSKKKSAHKHKSHTILTAEVPAKPARANLDTTIKVIAKRRSEVELLLSQFHDDGAVAVNKMVCNPPKIEAVSSPSEAYPVKKSGGGLKSFQPNLRDKVTTRECSVILPHMEKKIADSGPNRGVNKVEKSASVSASKFSKSASILPKSIAKSVPIVSKDGDPISKSRSKIVKPFPIFSKVVSAVGKDEKPFSKFSPTSNTKSPPISKSGSNLGRPVVSLPKSVPDFLDPTPPPPSSNQRSATAASQNGQIYPPTGTATPKPMTNLNVSMSENIVPQIFEEKIVFICKLCFTMHRELAEALTHVSGHAAQISHDQTGDLKNAGIFQGSESTASVPDPAVTDVKEKLFEPSAIVSNSMKSDHPPFLGGGVGGKRSKNVVEQAAVGDGPFTEIMDFSEPVHINGRRRYKCRICDKSYLDTSQFKRHFCTHTGERNFHCSVENCEKKFGSFDKQRQHERVVHKIFSKNKFVHLN